MQIRSGKSTSYATSKARPNTKKASKQRRANPLTIYSLIGAAIIILIAAGLYFTGSDTPATPIPGPAANAPPVPPVIKSKATPTSTPEPAAADISWEGPVLYHSPLSAPIHLILVEKALQTLHLYRYDGGYRRIKTYSCATGERTGQKKVENDKKTPEGIYFNTKSYRDRQVTVFGDRAFELNYPNAFDDIAGNSGHGIYIHGSNRKVTPNSTNGCVALDNQDLEDLDKRVEFDKTPVIIGARLPYTFTGAKRDVSKLAPLFRQAMIPKKYAGKKLDFPGITILRYQNKLVSFGALKVTAAPAIDAVSRLYLAEPETGLMVMIKREWQVKIPAGVISKQSATSAASRQEDSISTLVTSWKTAWESKRLSAYIAHYHPGFVGNGRNIEEWKHYKNRLNKKYKRISVTVSDLKTRTTGNTSRAWFKQKYRSDAFRSDGYKILEFRKRGKDWKIFRETSYGSKPKGWPA